MNKLPPSLIDTWLFLAQSDDPRLAKSKFIAYKRIRQNFGTCELAHLYIEQANDNAIEIIII